jgi:hypothetical protein
VFVVVVVVIAVVAAAPDADNCRFDAVACDECSVAAPAAVVVDDILLLLLSKLFLHLHSPITS